MSEIPADDPKTRILEAVRQVWTGDSKFTVKRVAKAAGLKPREVRRHFPRKSDLVTGVWLDAAERVRACLSEPPEGAPWTLEEELANLIYGFFEIFEHDEEFFITSLDRIADPLRGPSRFHRALARHLGEILRRHHPTHWAGMLPVEDLAAWHVLHLMRFWVRDSTPGRERTWALADKSVSFGVELYTSPLPGQAWDLGRALWRAGAFSPAAAWDQVRRHCRPR